MAPRRPDNVGDIKKSEAAANDGTAETPSPLVQGVVASNAKMNISMKVVQGSPGSDPILPGKAADTLVHALLDSE